MAKSEVKKVVAKRKVNHYTAIECKAELARLDSAHKDKNGFVMGDSSKYRKDIQEQLASFN